MHRLSLQDLYGRATTWPLPVLNMASISLSVLVFILISVLVDCTNIIVRQLPKTIYFPDKVKVSVDCSASIPQQNNVIFLVFLNDNVVDTSNPSDLVYPEQTTHGDLQTWTISITKDDSLNYQILKCKIMTIDSSMFEILDETSGTIVVIYQTPGNNYSVHFQAQMKPLQALVGAVYIMRFFFEGLYFHELSIWTFSRFLILINFHTNNS